MADAKKTDDGGDPQSPELVPSTDAGPEEEPKPKAQHELPQNVSTGPLKAGDGETEKMQEPGSGTADEDGDQKTEHSTEHSDSAASDTDLSSSHGHPAARTTSAQSKALSIVPRSKRRGLFAQVAIIPEVDRPYDYSNRTKWIITAVISLAGAGAPFGSGIFYPSLSEMSKDLNATPAVTNLTVAMYMIAMSIFPLWWSSFSEEFGRRSIYIISFTLFVLFSILSAVSPNIAMLIVMRLLGGGASASVQAVGAGTIADIWEPRERGTAMGIFYLGPLIGPLVGPIVGGALSQGFGWRSTMWFCAAYGAVMLLCLVFVLPETLAVAPRAPQLTRAVTAESVASSVSRKAKGVAHFAHRFLIEPLAVLTMLRLPAVFLTVFWASITFGALYFLNISIQEGFGAPPYSFEMVIVGVMYVPPSLGYTLASIFGGRWIDRIMVREATKAGRYGPDGKLAFLPEDRFAENAWVAGATYPLALIMYGWTVEKGLHWIVPCIGSFFFGVGSMLVFSLATTSLTEFVPKRGSQGVAVNNFLRNIFSCVGAVVAQPIISGLGQGWTFTILGLATFFLGYLSVWMIQRYSKKWRKSMDEALGNEA